MIKRYRGGLQLLFCIVAGIFVTHLCYAGPVNPLSPSPPINQEVVASNGPILTLKEAILLAMRFSPEIKNAELQRVVDKFSLAVARNQFAPQIGLTAQALFQNGSKPNVSAFPTLNYLLPFGTQINTGLTQQLNPGTNTISNEATVTITQPLLRGFGRDVTTAPLKNAQDTEQVNRLNFKNNVITTVINVIQAYYQLVQAYNNLAVNQLSLRDEQVTLNQTLAKIKVGKAAQTEQIQQQLNIANSQLSLSQNQSVILQSYQNLLLLLGLDPNARINVDKKINANETPLPSLSESISIALANNIAYQSALLGYKITERALLVAKDQQKWQLDAVGMLMQPISDPGQGNTSSGSKSLTLNLAVPIHDLARQQQYVSAKVALQQAKTTLALQKYQLISNVTNAYNTVEFSKKQLQLSAQSVQLANQSLLVAKIKFNYGKTTSFELTSLQTTLANARIGYISQQIQYISAVENFFQILGTTLEKWQISLSY